MIRILCPRKIAFISSFPPRKCGISTFASHLTRGICSAGGMEFCPSVIAMESGGDHQYARPVEFVVRRNVPSDYGDAADYINSQNIDAASLQHEFGLFGGEGGAYLGLLLKRLKVPVITTLHTVLQKPSTEYANALMEICEISDTVVVMNIRGVHMLTDIYGVPREKIRLIPHGIPDIPSCRSCFCQRGLGPSGKRIILTFGLIGRNKGIEVMLRAMPAIIKSHPETLYIVLGTTHPEVVKNEGHAYRNELIRIVEELGLGNHVLFHDKFVSDQELTEFLTSADIYVTPYLEREQLTSGTLAFAVGAGKAVVSTPYWAAEELLAHGRGRLVPFGDSEQMASAIVELLDDDSLLNAIQMRAYEYGRAMTWPRVGQAYWNLVLERLQSESVPAGADMDPWRVGLGTQPCSQRPLSNQAV